MILVKRVYEPRAESDGARFLVDRLWPRGAKKEALALEGWLKDLAPSDGLRKWFNHDPSKWSEFQRRYFAELDENSEIVRPLLDATRRGKVTLLFGARDAEHNNAVALKRYLSDRLKGSYSPIGKPPALPEYLFGVPTPNAAGARPLGRFSFGTVPRPWHSEQTQGCRPRKRRKRRAPFAYANGTLNRYLPEVADSRKRRSIAGEISD